MAGPDIDDDRRELSIVEPDSFTATRNARAKELRAAKEKERAAVVAKLPKPTWTAWALNVLARDDPDEIEAWLAAGDALDAALSGAASGDRDALRAAQHEERRAHAHTVDRAAEILTGAGRKVDDQARQRLGGTLRAAVTDPAVCDLLVSGTLADDVDAPTFGFGFAVPDDDNVVSMASARASRAASRTGSTATGGASTRRRSTSAGAGEAADEDADAQEEARRAEEQRAREEAERVEAERAEAERLAAERARLEDELAARQAELEARATEAADADEAARRAHAALDEAAAAVEAARAELDALDPSG